MLLLVIAELRIKVYLKYFNFLTGPIGKGVYIIFLGTIILDNGTAALVVGICVIVLGVAYVFVCRKA